MRSLRWAFIWFLCLAAPVWGDDTVQAWQALREGRAVLMMRHATAPGIGDPPHFKLGDCATQRNLDERGRVEARRWGLLLAERGIERPRILSSRWCRALDTATGMGLGKVEPLPALDSFFEARDREARQSAALRRTLASLPPGRPVILVSHQVNITALTGVFPRSGEALILALPLAEPPRILARILPP